MPRTRPSLAPDCLEPRQLLSLAASWQGQDGQDLAGPTYALLPSGVQDIHIALTGLPADRDVTVAVVQGLGGGEWVYRGQGAWAAAFLRSGATTGDLYFEPYRIEDGRPFHIDLTYDDGSTDGVWVTGGAADPTLRAPDDALEVAWIGQEGTDAVGPGPAVGPDGIQDAVIALTNLTPTVPIESVRVEGPPGIAWAAGTNPEALSNAQLRRLGDDPSRAELSLNPDRDLDGQALRVTVVYTNGATDAALLTAGPTDPGLRVAPAPPLPPIVSGVSARWAGQDGVQLAGPGDVHLVAENLPASQPITSAVLTDEAGLAWAYRAPGAAEPLAGPNPRPLGLRRSSPVKADLGFPPARDESGGTLTLRLNFADGSIAVVPIAGKGADPTLRAPKPAPTSVVAHPGDDLNDLATRFGTVRLSAGTYPMDRPLVLARPVTITAEPGATLLFSQPADAPPWTAAIKIHVSNVTLDAFAVRFAGPVRWDWGVPYGPAVVGTTDDRDRRDNPPKVNLAFTRLDIQGPPASEPGGLEPAPGLFRLVTAESGRITGNTLQGGPIELIGGPWTFSDNDHRGTTPGTWSTSVLSAHQTHDLVVERNRVEPASGSGKLYRFLVLTQSGYRDRIEGNTVRGVGPMDTDTAPNPNAAEVVLTEAYRLKFEGSPLAVSGDGLFVQIPDPPGGPADPGDVVAVLDGPAAGTWRRVVQTLDARTYRLDAPLPAGTGAISIGAGFVGELFRGNTIDARGSSVASDVVLAGAHYGTQFVSNRLVGGQIGLKAQAGPSESPVEWGWSHTPQFGMTIQDNTIVDAIAGSFVGVEHDAAIKSTKGRVYFGGSVTNNAFGWSPDFRVANPTPLALTVGELGSLDPAEQLISLANNRSLGAASTIAIVAGRVNGSDRLDDRLDLPLVTPPPPTRLRLRADTGAYGNDRVTSDARLIFDAAPNAAGYEYRVGDGPYTRFIAGTLTPSDLPDGPATVGVRAIDEYGVPGPEATLSFTLDTTPPAGVAVRSIEPGPTIRLAPLPGRDGVQYRVGSVGPFRNLGNISGFVPAGLLEGDNLLTLRPIDLAGNLGPETTIRIAIPPARLAGAWLGQPGADLTGPREAPGGDGIADIGLRLAGLKPGRALASVLVEGLGGGAWALNGPPRMWPAAVLRSADGTAADVFFQPYQPETGRPYHVWVTYDDGTRAEVWIDGGPVDPRKPVATAPVAPSPAGTLTPQAESGPAPRGPGSRRLRQAHRNSPRLKRRLPRPPGTARFLSPPRG